jgi:hypothetical protein
MRMSNFRPPKSDDGIRVDIYVKRLFNLMHKTKHLDHDKLNLANCIHQQEICSKH